MGMARLGLSPSSEPYCCVAFIGFLSLSEPALCFCRENHYLRGSVKVKKISYEKAPKYDALTSHPIPSLTPSQGFFVK